MKKIAIMGSTGSIGRQTLEIVRKEKDLQVVALACSSNIELMEQQIREFKPRLAVVWDELAWKKLCLRLNDIQVEILQGMDGLLAMAEMEESQILVTALVGMIGIRPTIHGIQAGKDIALANKETLVTAGHLIMPLAKTYGVKILPVDSEHSAIFQCLRGEEQNPIERILLTASGGPFRGKTSDELKLVTKEQALKHPNWAMGNKITIDSATMVNKGLEVMEAKWLFGVSLDQIQVVVHPQSVIHSMVEFMDGAVMAQMGTPDMKIPIQFALFYPERKWISEGKLDLFQIQQLTFEKPDFHTFYGLKMAYDAGTAGGSMPTVYNAANEMAVDLFLRNKICFHEIPEIIQAALESHRTVINPNLDQILATEQETYEFIQGKY